DARDQAEPERDLRHEVEPEPDLGDRAPLAQLGLAQRLGLATEPHERVLAASEGLEHADAVHALLDAGGQVAGLILTAPGERAVALLEQVALNPHGYPGDKEDRAEQPVPAEQQHG